jgi:hypothetical protein
LLYASPGHPSCFEARSMWGASSRSSSGSSSMTDLINKLKEYDYWRIFSRFAVGTIVMYVLKIMKDAPNG